MRWVVLLLLCANLGLAGYLTLVASGERRGHDPATSEFNADQVRRLDAGPARNATRACLEWGPLDNEEVARARAQLTPFAAAEIVVREAPPNPGWWVYVVPARSREDAQRRARELDALGVADARVVTDDPYRNAVSLGVFRSEEAALAYQSDLRKIKVRNTAVVQRSDLHGFSIIVIAEPAADVTARLVELHRAFAGSEVKAAACPMGIDSARK